MAMGYIASAESCHKHGDLKCGVCDCHEGFIGMSCECNDVDSTGTISEDTCRQTNTSAICSNRGQCKCGQCQCKEPADPIQKIDGLYCECNNYECNNLEGKICSGHGECDCNTCICDKGWKGRDCSCNNNIDNCMNRDTEEICSNHGTCECNKCKCNGKYFGKWCEDCQTCSGKCSEFKPCVQCEVFKTGELNQDQCQEKCDPYNISIVSEFAKDLGTGKRCSFLDKENCRFDFVYELDRSSGNVSLWVKQDLDCQKPINVTGVIFGVIGAMLAIGLLALIVWKLCAILQDRREYARFLRTSFRGKCEAAAAEPVMTVSISLSSENPLFRRARTTIQNPLFNSFE
ncbi:integrin beta-PS-like [Penaeus indicus]|uniref:integrin beta-PS-like n=1 Tax=Penaeus indicus TaxID=29960 RepID=UPI00300D3E89